MLLREQNLLRTFDSPEFDALPGWLLVVESMSSECTQGQGPCDNWLAWLAVLKLMTTAKPQHQMHCWQVLVTRCYMMLLVCWKLHIGMKNPENCPRLLQSGTTILGYLVSSSVNLERWWMSPLCGRCLWYSQNLPVESAAGLGTFCAGRRS